MKNKFSLLREKLEGLSYPDNHTFDPETLLPTGILINRIKLLHKNAPEMMNGGKRFLDVGSNKGFMSFYLRDKFEDIIGYEPGKEFVEFSNTLKKAHGVENIKFLIGSFHDIPDDFFDVVYLGNCLHYIFRHDIRQGLLPLSYIEKIKKLCSNILVVDGPQNYWEFAIDSMSKTENWSEEIKKEFTLDNFTKKLGWCLIRTGYNGIGSGKSGRTTAVFRRV